jgi:hypothetical protein
MRHKQHFHRAPTETRSGGPPKIVCLFESSTVVMVTQEEEEEEEEEEEVCTKLINKQQSLYSLIWDIFGNLRQLQI